jgi:PAS domain S-box-containing protein
MPSAKAAGAVSQYTLGFVTPAAAYMMAGKLYHRASRGVSIEARMVGANQIEVIVIQKPGVKEKPYQCENRLGVFEGAAKLFTNKLARVEHPLCMHTSGDRCIYHIQWEETPSNLWKRIVRYGSLLAAITSIILFFSLPALYSAIALLSLLSIVMGASRYQISLEKNELTTVLKNHGDTARDLLNEIDTRYNNAMLVQEIGQASSHILNIDKLLQLTLEVIEKRLDFERGLIMLADRNQTHLTFRVGFGYSEEKENILRHKTFSLDDPNSRGPFVTSFRQQKPFLINDLQETEKIIATGSSDFAEQMGVKSLLCVPIVYDGKAEGILAVDNHRSSRQMNQSDMSLLSGIAHQIGASIHNAKTYRLVRESEERFRALIQNSSDVISILDEQGRFIYNTPSVENLFGYPTEDLIGKSPFNFIHSEDLARADRAFVEGVQGTNQGIPTEFRFLKKDGSWSFVESLGSNLFNYPGINGLVITSRDITERKRAEEEKRILEERLRRADKMEAIGTLAGGIAHDFNNLLMGIQGYASLTLLDLDPSHPHYEQLRRIEEQVQSGADLTRQLLGFARGGRYEVKASDMNDIIKKTSSMFGRTKKEISIHRKYGKGLRSVEVDQGQMEQVFMNLYVNAWQAMPGGGKIYLETEDVLWDEAQAFPHAVKPGKYVKITVTDTGTGMDEKTRERIFDPFFTTKEMGRGTGLGLATVYGIIKGHKGAINVYSEPGHGTTFTIYLPASEKEVVKEKTATGTIARGTETILLVDDEKMVLDVNKELLKSMGYRVYAAGSGQGALAVYMEKRNEIDLVILDMIMPGISGGETFDRLREINPDAKIILSSGYSLTGEAQTIMDRGCNGFLQKPFQLSDLSRKVREMLD